MSTVYNYDEEMAASTVVPQAADIFLGHQAATGLKKTFTGAQFAGLVGGVVATTAGAVALTITQAAHAGRTVVLNNTAPIAVTLPQATGSGAKYKFFVAVAATATGSTIKVANATDVMAGFSFVVTTTATNGEAFATSATSDTVTINGTTLGGVLGDTVEFQDVKTGIFQVTMLCAATGTEATPFSATV